MITASDFVKRWSQSNLREQQAAQSHFNELCRLVGHKTPTELDPAGESFTFEKQVTKDSGTPGRADVWYKGRFAWEYKGRHRDLDDAYHQLLAYKTDLDNPPLLVVCDFLEYRIYPQWTNANAQPFVFHNDDLRKTDAQNYIRWLLEDPGEFLEERKRQLREREQITQELAADFAKLAEQMRHYQVNGAPAWTPMQIARFLTKLVFALFAENIGLLPKLDSEPVLRYIVDRAMRTPEAFAPALKELFRAMNGETKTFFMKPVPYFNGGLFADSEPGAGDGVEVLDLAEASFAGALEMLDKVSGADWQHVNPTIFGTLFERALDESKRTQLGAHYTSEADIRLIVEPVLMAPLYRLWDETRAEAEPLLQTYLDAETSPRERVAAETTLRALHDWMMDRLAGTRVLDPACGSGNFLYVSLRALKDLEARVRQTFEPLRLPFRDAVTPRQLYGIEKDEFAARLAQVVVWIGYLQWRYEDAGSLRPAARLTGDPHEVAIPILKDKEQPSEPDRILNADAILRHDAEGRPYEPEWPEADVIVSNPPFLGGNRIRAELGDQRVDTLFELYRGRVPASADLVCYWFEKARANIEHEKAKRAGLLATNSIRGGANRDVLKRIKETGDIFMAWDDRPWLLDGAAVRVSMIGFDTGSEASSMLNGVPVVEVNADLTASVDLTNANKLLENRNLCLRTDEKGGPFDISAQMAETFLKAINRSGKSNSDVVHPWINASDVTSRSRGMWIIDFGVNTTHAQARAYELPFSHVETHVKPKRSSNNVMRLREQWWLHRVPGADMRAEIAKLRRYIATPTVAKHRLFVWLDKNIMADHQLYAFIREDDYFFGALHAYPHEIWSLRMGTWLGKGNDPRYTPTTTFETYPFPYPPGKEPTDDPAVRAISAAAKALAEEREAWLNPPELAGALLKKRTLTNLYNALVDYRQAQRAGKPWLVSDLRPGTKFAARLADLHAALDAAVLNAYGWADLIGTLRTAAGDEELLRRLLALNLGRFTSPPGPLSANGEGEKT